MEKIPVEVLRKRNNFREIEVTGSTFLLVGGTHSTVGESEDAWKHYLRVKAFFDSFEYDAICMEMVTFFFRTPYHFEVKFFDGFIQKIRQEGELWAELSNGFTNVSLKYPKFVKLFTGEDDVTRGDLQYCGWVLEKISGDLSKKNQEKLSEVLEGTIKQYKEAYLKETHLPIYNPDRINFNSMGTLFLLKAIRKRKDFVFCDILEGPFAQPLMFVQPYILSKFIPTQMLPNVVILGLLFIYFAGVSESGRLHQKYGPLIDKLSRCLNFAFDTPVYMMNRYRETLTALQLMNLAESFKKEHGHNGTFIYWSHVGHTRGVFENLQLAKKRGKDVLKKKLNRPEFAIFRTLYREHILFKTSEFSESTRSDFFNAAQRAGISKYDF